MNATVSLNAVAAELGTFPEFPVGNIRSMKDAETIIHSLSAPSKMPTFGYSISAFRCNVGGKLANIAGSVCADCYAKKGRYVFDNVVKAHASRLAAMENPLWVAAMIYIMLNKKHIRETGIFRWHDSGDLQNFDHLLKIVAIAKATPNVRHWLPTKEKGLVRKYLRTFGAFPANLIVRVSGAMVDGKTPEGFANTSTVTTDASAATCHASERGGLCGDCRKCWDANETNIAYLKH